MSQTKLSAYCYFDGMQKRYRVSEYHDSLSHAVSQETLEDRLEYFTWKALMLQKALAATLWVFLVVSIFVFPLLTIITVVSAGPLGLLFLTGCLLAFPTFAGIAYVLVDKYKTDIRARLYLHTIEDSMPSQAKISWEINERRFGLTEIIRFRNIPPIEIFVTYPGASLNYDMPSESFEQKTLKRENSSPNAAYLTPPKSNSRKTLSGWWDAQTPSYFDTQKKEGSHAHQPSPPKRILELKAEALGSDRVQVPTPPTSPYAQTFKSTDAVVDFGLQKQQSSPMFPVIPAPQEAAKPTIRFSLGRKSESFSSAKSNFSPTGSVSDREPQVSPTNNLASKVKSFFARAE